MVINIQTQLTKSRRRPDGTLTAVYHFEGDIWKFGLPLGRECTQSLQANGQYFYRVMDKPCRTNVAILIYKFYYESTQRRGRE